VAMLGWVRQCHSVVWMVAGGTVLLLVPGSGLGELSMGWVVGWVGRFDGPGDYE
jgi:hypothetical protein